MNCPHCRDKLLITIEHEQIEVDYCPACKGVWLDIEEIELLFEDKAAAHAFLTIGKPAAAPANEKPRKCPECRARMTKESTEGAHAVIFDHCPNGDGIWFDHGELATVLSHADSVGGNEQLTTYLAEIFSSDGGTAE